MWTARFEGGQELAATLLSLPPALSYRVLIEGLKEAAEPMRGRMAELAPREPGAPDLADNIGISVASRIGSTGGGRWRAREEGEAAVAVGPTKFFFYGCVFGAGTYVSTDKGQKAICSIRVGDKVLTQTGEFRPVLATYRYPATLKPDLVTITARYRKGLVHTLTLTRDHKVLVFRDEKHQWVEAGQIFVGDVLAKRRKISWSKGTAKTEQRVCEGCGQAYVKRTRGRGQLPSGASAGKRFCSNLCRARWLAQHHIGMTRSDSAKEKMAKSARERLANNPESHPNRLVSAKGFKTQCEKAVEEWLIARGVAYRSQHPIGVAFVDFYLPDSDTIIEADGAYWHQDQQRDIERDRRLLQHAPNVRIVHTHFVDARFTPERLDREPLPSVSYVPCNPGPSSFVDPDVFVGTPVLSVKHWRYEQTTRTPVKLYDVTVEGVPSFVASGVVIHNSFQEFGTSRHGAQPFARPAFDTEAPKALGIMGRVFWTILASKGISRATRTSAGPISGGSRGSLL